MAGESKDKYWIFWVILAVTFLLLGGWGYVGFNLICPTLPETSAKAGQFGDWFGAFNALFSSLAATGAVFAVYMQIKESRAARIDRKNDEVAQRREETVRLTIATTDFLDREVERLSDLREKTRIMMRETQNELTKISIGTPAHKEGLKRIQDLIRHIDELNGQIKSFRRTSYSAKEEVIGIWEQNCPEIAARVAKRIEDIDDELDSEPTE